MDRCRISSARSAAAASHPTQLRRLVRAGVRRPIVRNAARDAHGCALDLGRIVEVRRADGFRSGARDCGGGSMTMQFRKIVVGVDFSDASLAAARWVADYLAPRGELLLVHVVSMPRPPIYLHGEIAPTIDQRSTLVPRLYAALTAFGQLLGHDRVRVGIRTGIAWSSLAHVAKEVNADLICVGRGNKRKGSSRFGATTPQRLLAVAGVPVVVIPQGVVAKPSRVVAALSARAGGDCVLPVAQQLASSWTVPLDAVHVIEPDIRRVLTSARFASAPQFLGSSSSTSGRQVGIDGLGETALR